MNKIMFAAALTVGLITAPMPQFMSTASAQQQASAPDKNAKPKREQSPGQVAARERQKKCAAEWKLQKAAGKIERERPGQNIGAPATSASRPPPTSARQVHSGPVPGNVIRRISKL
jgi:hypothetical protein